MRNGEEEKSFKKDLKRRGGGVKSVQCESIVNYFMVTFVVYRDF